MNELLLKRKKKRDIVITLSNSETFNKKMNLFKDGYWNIHENKKPSEFILGSIRIYCSNSYFFNHSNEIELGKKIYNISHYLNKDYNNESIIYDFEKGWLSPLNITINTDKDITFDIPSSTTLLVSISIV